MHLPIWLVFAGTILSAAFILAANSWMQHPVGYNDHTPTQIFSIPHLIFSELYPRLMVSSTSSAFNLTIRNSASPSYQPKVMTVVALVLLPIVIAYTAWTYYVFRRRISDKDFVTAMKEENAHDHVH